MTPDLIIEGVSKTYPNGVRALQEVSLTIPAGMFGLLGPNGAGKTTAIGIVDSGLDRALDGFERGFLYLPFEHAEDLAMQDRSIALFTQLAHDTGNRAALEWAEKHAAIVRRFGRYPHRNAILGRASTPEEIAFLREPGSSF